MPAYSSLTGIDQDKRGGLQAHPGLQVPQALGSGTRCLGVIRSSSRLPLATAAAAAAPAVTAARAIAGLQCKRSHVLEVSPAALVAAYADIGVGKQETAAWCCKHLEYESTENIERWCITKFHALSCT